MPFATIKVLVIDDNYADYLIMKNLLTGMYETEFEISYTDSYDEALPLLVNNEYDVYFIDYVLTGHSGLDLLREAVDKGCKAPVIVYSGQGDRMVDAAAINLGAMDYLIKGKFSSEHLEHCIRNVITQKSEYNTLLERYKVKAESLSLLTQVLNTLPACVAFVSGEGRIIAANRSWEAFFSDCSHGEVADFFSCSRSILPREHDYRKIFSGICSGELKEFEFEYGSESERGRAWWKVLFLPAASHEFTGIVITHRDITREKNSIRQIEGNERRFRALLQNSIDAINLSDAEGNILYASDAGLRITGYSVTEVIGRNSFEFIYPEDQDMVRESVGRLISVPGSQAASEFRIIRKDGAVIWIEATATNMIEEESVRAIVVNYRDITAKKEAAEQLAQSEAKFRALIQNSYDAVELLNEKGDILYVSESVVRILGYSSEELIGVNVFQFICPEDVPFAREKFEELLASASNVETSFRVRHKNGELRWVEIVGLNMLHDNTVNAVVVNFRDGTARKEAAEKLARSEAKFRAMVRNSQDCIELCDETGRITFVSPSIRNVLGYEPEEIIGMNSFELLHPDDTGEAARYLSQVLSTGEPAAAISFRGRHADGGYRWLEATAINMLADPDLQSIVINFRDITERRLKDAKILESEEKYRKLVEMSPDVIIIISESTIEFINQAGAALLGLDSPDDIIGQDAFNYIPAEYSSSARKSLRKILREPERIFYFEYTHPVEDGSPVYLEGSGQAFYYRGKPAVQLVIRDVTRKKVAEDLLFRQQQELLTLVENTPDPIVRYDLNGRIIYINKAFEKNFRIKRADLIGRTPLELGLDPEYAGRWMSNIMQVVQTGQDVLSSYSFETGEGQIYFQAHSAPEFSKDGKVSSVLAINRDITDLKRSESEHREHSALLDNASDAIIHRDLDNRVLFWNKSAEQLYGWSLEEVSGVDIRDLIYDDRGEFEEAMAILMENGSWTGELYQRNRNGDELITECRWTLIRDEKQKPLSILAINRNITEKKHLEAQLLRVQRTETIGTLASGIAHDLNNILSPILLSVEILKRSFPDTARRTIETIGLSAQRGADIVRQVLGFARGVEVESRVLDVTEAVRELGVIVTQTFPKSIEFRCSLREDLWNVNGDHTQLQQVLINLCVNSRDAIKGAGTITLSAENVVLDEQYVRMNPEARSIPYVMISVSDTGSGIPQKIIDKIFDPFFTTKEIGKGTGLGLSTVRAIVQSHGGFIVVQSEENRGACFKVYLPAAAETGVQARETEVLAHPAAHGKCIMVVDDEAAILEITKSTLEMFGYRVMTATDGTEALSMYAGNMAAVDLVLTDIMMPVLDGKALITILRRLNPQLKVIASSGISENRKALDLHGFDDILFLPKPYTAERLVTAIESVVFN